MTITKQTEDVNEIKRKFVSNEISWMRAVDLLIAMNFKPNDAESIVEGWFETLVE